MGTEKKFKVSYSALDDYYKCERYYYLTRIEKWDSPEEGASLSFGSAVDAAVMALLENKGDPYDIFLNFKKTYRGEETNAGWNYVFDNPNILYTIYDYDANILDAVDEKNNKTLIKSWENELGVTRTETIKRKKTGKYKKFNGKFLQMYQRLCWLSMKHKGIMMIDAFKDEVLPKIRKVYKTQRKVSEDLAEGIEWNGFVDLVADYEGYDKPIVFDVKTSRLSYDNDKVLLSDQLRVYSHQLREEYNTNLVGYIVLLKTFGNDFYCDTCGKEKKKGSRARNCVDCDGGKYKSKPKAKVQILIGEYTDEDLDAYKEERAYKAKEIRWKKNKVDADPRFKFIFTRDMNNCKKYGLCKMFRCCHYKDMSGYKKRK